MKSDALVTKKSLHINLDKEVHAELRVKSFHHGVSIQELFDEFARQVIDDAGPGYNVLKGLVTKKIRAALDDAPKPKRDYSKKLHELDAEAMYTLIEENERREKLEEIARREAAGESD